MKNKSLKLIFLVLIALLLTSKIALALPLPPKISLPQKQIDKSSYIPSYQINDSLSDQSQQKFAYSDFSETLTKGIGFKYSSNQNYLDFRINNFSNFSLPIELNNKVIFTPSSDIKITYTIFKNKIKEEIILNKKPKTNTISFSFEKSNELKLVKKNDGYHLVDIFNTSMFIIQNPVVFDKNKNNGPVSLEIKGSQAILTVSQDFLDKATYPVTIDPTVIADNSSDMYSTAFSNQRKILYDGTNYWAFYVKQNGLFNQVFYEYSSDGINWSGTPQTITDAKVTSGYQFSLWQNGNTVYLAILHNSGIDKSSIKVKKGTINLNSITWGSSWSTALLGTNPTTNYYSYPSITQDSQGKIWVVARYSNGTNYWVRARRSLNPNSVSSWESTIYDLSNTSNPSDVVFPGIIPLSSNNRVYAFWYRDNTIEGKLFDGTSWNSTTTNIANTWTGSAAGIPSVVADSNDKICLAYSKETIPNLVYKTSLYPYSSWSEPIELASDGQYFPSLTLDSSNNNIYAFYHQYFGDSQSIVKVKQLGTTSSKTLSSSSERFFEAVLIYNAPSDNFELLTEQAASIDLADVKRTDTGAMIASTNDYLFVGMTEKFDSIFFDLSTPAQGFTLTIGYYNGTDFDPLPSYTDNTNNLSISLKDIIFNPPSDWTASDNIYWIIIGTATSPTTPPVGTQVTALKNNLFVSSNYKGNNKVFAFWTEGTTSNYRIRIGDLDNIAPNTTLTVDPTTPNGQNNWYISNPTITLASNEQGTTYYSWDSDSGPWTAYSTSFNAIEGQNTLYYYSRDTAGNNEEVKSQLFKVDTVLSSISEQTPTPNTTVNTYTPTISAKLTDSSSAIDPSTIVMKLDNQPVSHSYDLVTGIVSFTPLSNLTMGKHYVDLSVRDNAGNLSTSFWHFTVFGTLIDSPVTNNTTWTKDGSPYIISPYSPLYHDTFTINLGVTLTIDPGVIVKIDAPEVHINVEGTLIAEGTTDNKIVFTAFADDSYGGDTNNNGSTPITNLDHWDYINLSASSRLNHTIVKYGGGVDFGIGNDRYINGALYINNGSPIVTNSLISDNMNYGIKIAGSATPVITNNTITNTIFDPGWDTPVEGTGVYVIESALPTIINNTISNNALDGINFSGSSGSPVITDNSFTNNSNSAISISGSVFPVISGNIATSNNRNGISFNKNITQSGTWRAGDLPYIVNKDMVIDSGVTLTIEPGTIVKLEFGGRKRIVANGTLVANGTPSNKIIFTSVRDDSYAGDTNNDGGTTTPVAGDWENITLTNSGSILNQAVVKYGGRRQTGFPDEENGGVYLSGGSPSITNTTISNNNMYGIKIAGSAAPVISSSTIINTIIDAYRGIQGEGSGIFIKDSALPTIINNTISNNALDGINFSGSSGSPVITDNSFTNNSNSAISISGSVFPVISGNIATSNNRNGISFNKNITQSGTWRAGDLPYIVNKDMVIDSGVTLTIEPGTIVKLEFGGRKRIVANGTLVADGTPSNKVIFTSIRDDSYAGDTNNDGGTTTPVAGDWENITLTNSGSVLNQAVVKYGGRRQTGFPDEENGGVYLSGGSPSVANTTISNNNMYGIKIAGSATPVISSSTIINIIIDAYRGIQGEGSGIFIKDSASPTINYNNIYNNSSYGVYNVSAGIIDAVNNWWGAGTSPSGIIYGLTNYDPWALSPFTGSGGGDSPEGRYGADAPSGYFGEPVNTATGNYNYEHEDINIPGKGIPVQITRSYNSQDIVYNGPFGYGWTHNYNTNLRFNSDESITLMKANSQRYTFTKNPDGTYTTPEGIFETLVKNSDNTYTLKFKDQNKYNFNSSGFLTIQIDKYDNQTTLTYNANNLLTTIADPGGRTITFTYTNNRITQIQDQTGRNIQYGYDANSNLTTVTDMNNKTTAFTYDFSHQLLTIQEPEPSTNPFLVNHYDSNNKVDWQKDAFLNTPTYSYDTVNKKTTATDNKGKQTIHEFDERYRLTKSTDPLLNSTISVFTNLDLPDSVTNQNNKTTNFTYDANGNTVSTKDSLNHQITASYDLNNNNLLWTKDALLNQTTYNYDPTGKFLQSITSPVGNTSFDYYTDGLLKTLTDANNHTTIFNYNVYGNLTSLQDALLKVATFEYDNVGRMTASIDANNHKTQFVYDNQGNILTIKDPLTISDPSNKHQVDFTYDGNKNQKTFKDANNNLTSFDYDDMDNLITVIDANNKTTSYTYDANYNLATVTDSLLHTTTYDYYDNNKLYKITDSLNNILEFNYDPVGNLTKTIYPNGNEAYYSYYDDSLLNTVTYKNEPTSYTYTYNPTHTLNTVTDNNNKVFSYTYDNGNRLISANDQTNPAITDGFTIQRGYDGVSNLTNLTYAGITYTYGYNARDDLTSLISPSGTTTFIYDDAKNRTDINTPDNSNRHSTYNEANRITQVKNTTASGIQTFNYTHDSNGNILTENTTSYGYDALNRLTSWNQGGINTTYEYDDTGNLLEVADNGVPVKTFIYNVANQIVNSGFSYDANGNMTSDGTYTYIYDGENRLKEVKQGANTIVSYTYDYMGRRTSVTESGITTYYHYDGWNVVTETDLTGSTIVTYTYDNRNQLVSMTKNGNTYYYQYNTHGDVVSLTNSTGQVVNSYEYDPWGKILSADETVVNPYRYAGYRYDESTGLYYLQKRYYKPDIARFLTKDPQPGDLRNPQTLNPYIYVNNNPVNWIDPTGLCAESVVSKRTNEQFNRWAWERGGPTTGLEATLAATSFYLDLVGLGLPPALLVSTGIDIVSLGYTGIRFVFGEATIQDLSVSLFGFVPWVGSGTALIYTNTGWEPEPQFWW